LGKLLTIVEETLTGLRIVKGFNAEEKMQAQFADSNERYSKVFKRVIRKAYLASPLSEFLSTMVILIILYVGGSLVLSGSGKMAPASLIVYLTVFSQIIQPAKNITTAYFAIQKGMGSIDRIDQVLDAILRDKRPGYLELPRDMISIIPETRAARKSPPGKTSRRRRASSPSPTCSTPTPRAALTRSRSAMIKR